MGFSVWLSTVCFLLNREGAMVRPVPERNEQRIVARTAITLGVAVGMLLTFASVTLASAIVTWMVYPDSLIEAWTQVLEKTTARWKVASFVATNAVAVGALGALLDSPSFFNYAVVVTDELDIDHSTAGIPHGSATDRRPIADTTTPVARKLRVDPDDS